MEQLLRAIRHNDGTFPQSELQQIIDRKEEAIPYLLRIMNELKEDYAKVINEPARFDYVYAYYLLAQFRVKDLFPILIELLIKPGKTVEEIFNDDITEGIGRILASVYDGDIDSLQRLIEDTNAYEYARGQGLVALVALVFDGQLSREFVMDYFKRLMAERREEPSGYFHAEIICCCDDLYPEEVYPEIRSLYEDHVVETGIINLDSINRTLKRAKEEVLQESRQNPRYQLLTDTIGEMRTWASFNQERFDDATSGDLKAKTIVKEAKIGRNEPCPCGSGKKYKKCCGKNE